jgi:CRP/FNR family transcriptional regulator, anaerobic regulatory protein
MREFNLDNLSWLERFPPLLGLEPTAREILTKSARIVEAPVGTIAKEVPAGLM